MSGISMHLRHMLQQYETQLMAARRLARYRRARRLADGGEEPPMDPQVRRRAMVERVARELYDTILFTGTDNPVLGKICDRMGVVLGGEVRFRYPPGEEQVQILRESPSGVRPLQGEEHSRALQDLWRVTLLAVDESMV